MKIGLHLSFKPPSLVLGSFELIPFLVNSLFDLVTSSHF
jgi:hypothetical protein